MVALSSCTDEIIMENSVEERPDPAKVHSGMERMVFNDRDDIKTLISQFNQDNRKRKILVASQQFSDNEQAFVSLYEANYEELMSSITPAQLDSINNDEDELEFWPNDSVIADYQFQCLLNANREIEVEGKVYRYFGNGVAVAPAEYAYEIEENIEIINTIKTPENNTFDRPISITTHTLFYPCCYNLSSFSNMNLYYDDYGPYGNQDDLGNGNQNSPGEPITLSDGTYINGNDIREIEFKEDSTVGDGGWFHKFFTGIFGSNIVAIKKFNNHKKLVLGLYDQNYIIYSNIGTQLKFQKKVIGIWWNVKCEDMELGWEMVSIHYDTAPKPYDIFMTQNSSKPQLPTHAWNPFPMGTKPKLLLTIPFVNYKFTDKNLYQLFKAAVKKAYEASHPDIKKLINNDMQLAELMSFNDKGIFIVHGPSYIRAQNKRSINNKFFSKWFPCNYEFGFTIGNTISFKNFSFSTNDGVDLDCGSVYGAVKYKGQWLGARIKKISKINK